MTKTNQPRRPLLDFDVARSKLLSLAVPVTDTETVPLLEANGRVLASDVKSPMDVPAFANSAMDGYAIRPVSADSSVSRYKVTQRIAAGGTGTDLGPGEAARIFTGAPVPEGTFAVVPQENVVTLDNNEIQIETPVPSGDFVRQQGEDIARNSIILASGTLLRPAHLSLAASVGVTSLAVRRRLTVALLLTGDELVEPGNPLQPGQIYNSNRYWLQTLLRQAGCEVLDPGIIKDSAQATRDALSQASEKADVIITCGGVSVGEEDHVRAAVESMGHIDLWQIAMKPGKPLAYGQVRGKDFIGLPGNPVSAFITFVLMGLPFLYRKLGMQIPELRSQPVVAGFDWTKPDRRREFIRVRRRWVGPGAVVLERWPNQGSGVMSSVAWADGFVDIPPDTTFQAGDTVSYLSLSDLIAGLS